MNGFIREQIFLVPPFHCSMLFIMSDVDIRFHLDHKCQHNIVRVDAGFIQKIVFVYVFAGTEQRGMMIRQVNTDFPC